MTVTPAMVAIQGERAPYSRASTRFIERNRNRRMCYELLGEFFWRAIDEGELEKAAEICDILDRFYLVGD